MPKEPDNVNFGKSHEKLPLFLEHCFVLYLIFLSQFFLESQILKIQQHKQELGIQIK